MVKFIILYKIKIKSLLNNYFQISKFKNKLVYCTYFKNIYLQSFKKTELLLAVTDI